MDRRAFLAGLSGAALGAPAFAKTEQVGKIHRVGLVSTGTDPARPVRWQPFRDAMRELGYVEGRNLRIEHAFAGGRTERLPRLLSELIQARVDVIVTTGTRETAAVKQATSSIPIVMTVVADPVAQGFVVSLARPGGNITGLTNLVPGLSKKYVELLREAVPSASHFAVVANPPNPVPANRRELDDAVKAFGITLSIAHVDGPEDFETVLARGKKEGVGAIIAMNDPVTFMHRKRLVQLALKYRLPGIYWVRDYVDDGGLMTYSASFTELLRRAAVFVDKILRGAKPGDLPVEQPTKFELVINLKTAKALGLTIPPSLLLRADQIIE